MPRRGLPAFLGCLLTLLIVGAFPPEGQTLPNWMARQPSPGQQQALRPDPGTGLQEVAPPGAVQQLRQRLDRHHPNLRLISPTDDAVISSSEVDLVLEVDDWPVGHDPEFGGGPHVMVQIDARPPERLDAPEDKRLHLTLSDLQPGSHRFSAWAAYPWGESVKNPEAVLQGRFHLWKRVRGTQPGNDEPWLVPIISADGQSHQPLLLDWLIWNAPLQNLREGDERWRLRITINGDSFLMDRQDPLWIQHRAGNQGTDIQMELLNGLGEPMQPFFNNSLLHLRAPKSASPAWLRSTLNDQALRVLSGEPPTPLGTNPEKTMDEASSAETQAEVDALGWSDERIKTDGAAKESFRDVEAEDKTAADDETAAQESDISSAPEHPLATNLDPMPEPASPTTDPLTESDVELSPDVETSANPSTEDRRFPDSELGGSARELLNGDGSLRKSLN